MTENQFPAREEGYNSPGFVPGSEFDHQSETRYVEVDGKRVAYYINTTAHLDHAREVVIGGFVQSDVYDGRFGTCVDVEFLQNDTVGREAAKSIMTMERCPTGALWQGGGMRAPIDLSLADLV